MQHIDPQSCQTVIVGDFNMKSLTKQEENYNFKFEDHMKRNYNMSQYIKEPTHNSESVLNRDEYIFNMESLVRSHHIGC